VALAVPATAPAQLPPNNGGVDQYVAPVPDSRGDRPANPGHHGGGSSQLPARVRSSLPAGEEGAVLARLATDPGSGAPTGSGGHGSSSGNGDRDHSGAGVAGGGGSGGSGGGSGSGGGGGVATTGGTAEKDVSPVSAITSSISDDPAVAVTVAAILGLTLAIAAVAVTRRRRGGRGGSGGASTGSTS
jgi:hypothetical protein